ncbi:MAG: DUF3137 domain-containing protein [Planctomycetota bacterium]
MKSYDEFKAFYSEELLQEIEQLESTRGAYLLKSIFAIICTLAIFFVVWILLPPLIRNKSFTWYAPLLCFIFINGLILKWIWRGFRSRFKERIIQKLLHFIDPSLQYHPDRYISEYDFDRSDLFLQSYNRYKGDDLIRGKVGKTDIKCSEICVQDSDGDSTQTIFKGLFTVADFNKDFHGQTLVLPDKAEKFLGRLGKKLQTANPLRHQLIQLESPEFENKFVVYGSDQIEARYILTPSLMQRILEFKKRNKSKLYLSFSRNKLYIAIALTRNLFEPGTRKRIDYLSVCQYFQDLQMAIGVVEDLNLNTRIWTKE